MRADAGFPASSIESPLPEGSPDADPQRWDLVSMMPQVNDFQRALLLEQQAFHAALATAQCGMEAQLTPLIADLYAMLRSPAYPKRAYLSLADALVKTAACNQKHVQLYGVLASLTAVTEVHSILRCAALFKRYGFTPQLKLFLVRWENLVEIAHQDAQSRARAFAQQVHSVGELAKQAGFADAVIPIDVQVDSVAGEIHSPLDAQQWSCLISGTLANPGSACPALARDVSWCRGFYARQDSLRWLGERQALFDLAIRRMIGRRISSEAASDPYAADRVTAMVSLELHKRFLPCYAASVPILNLDTRANALKSSSSAVA